MSFSESSEEECGTARVKIVGCFVEAWFHFSYRFAVRWGKWEEGKGERGRGGRGLGGWGRAAQLNGDDLIIEMWEREEERG